MNRELIELYFEVQKELDTFSKEESKQIEAFAARLIEKNEKITPSNELRNRMLDEFRNKKIIPLLENSCAKKSNKSEMEQKHLQLISETLEEILGDDFAQAKRIVKGRQLEKIVEKYVE